MAVGKPAILSGAVPTAQEVEMAGAGWAVPVGAVQELTSVLDEIAGQRTILEQMGRNAREYAAQYTWEAFCLRLEQTAWQLVDPSPPDSGQSDCGVSTQ
jgi:glycosyltransferase involved in cell wall biosynthesis